MWLSFDVKERLKQFKYSTDLRMGDMETNDEAVHLLPSLKTFSVSGNLYFNTDSFHAV